jgi:hypothetical protein
MPLNTYFVSENMVQGSPNENMVLEDLIEESISIWGQMFFYIPRTLVAKDEILGEDRLSRFQTSYPIPMYLETPNGFAGSGEFMSKFGYFMEQSIDLTVSKRKWHELVGSYGDTILPNRPAEGDLIYYPIAKKLFEIKFVEKDHLFYQLGKLYTYKLTVETFQYSSERLDTGVGHIDAFESLQSFTTDTSVTGYGILDTISITNQGSGYTSTPAIEFESVDGSGAEAVCSIDNTGLVSSITITNRGSGYFEPPLVKFVGGGGQNAAAICTIKNDIDVPDSFGDNNKFKEESKNLIFDVNNPFGNL